MSRSSSSTPTKPTPPRAVTELLASLRTRIRWYVVAEGIAVLVAWLGIAFWTALAVDYLPVLLGASEMPRGARIVVLALVAVGAGWILYRYVLRRVFCRLHESSLALLIERRFPVFRDSLVTTVEISAHDLQDGIAPVDFAAIGDLAAESNRRMLSQTIDRATSQLEGVTLRKVFSYRPLLTKLGWATLAVASFVLLGVLAREAWSTSVSRLVLLSSEPWPRRAFIEMVGFENGQQKVAKGSDLTVRVRADATRDAPPPDVCTILYETVEGDRGRVNMSRDGEPREDESGGRFQYYVFNGKPFKGILDDIRFDVVGRDYRVRDQRIKVVLSPVVVAVQLHGDLPDYTDLLPRNETWTPGTQFPIGSQITARIQTSKELRSATIKDIDGGDETRIDVSAENSGTSRREIRHEIPFLDGRHAVSISLHDTDGIDSAEPFLLTIGAVADASPKVDMALRGIGSAITPIARLPIEGTIQDDYEIARSWFEVKVGDVTRQFPFRIPGDDQFSEALDLRLRGANDQAEPLRLEPQDRVLFSVKAEDRFDLTGEPHVGTNEPIVLTVVRPDELLAILDGRELGLRRRFEQIRGEMVESRDSLVRLRASWQPPAPPAADGDPNDEAAQRNLAELRARWAQWAAQKAEQSTQEVAGVAVAFEDIREELVNNRVDTPERKSRLEEQIIAPLRTIAEEMFPEFSASLATLRARLAERSAAEQSRLVVEQADRIVIAMDQVIQKMLELEDYAELVNIVRSLIEQQEKLLNETREEQRRRALDLFK